MVLCKEVSKRHRVLNRNFARSWCFGANNNGDNDGDSSNNASNDSNLATTTSRDEAEERAQSSDDFDSDESKASISSRSQLAELMGDKYNLFMVEEPNSEGPDPRGGPRVSFGMLRKEINRLPREVVKYFTDPNAIEPHDMQLLFPFVESALPLAYGVLGVQLFHEVGHFFAAFPKKVKLSIPFFIPNITLGSFGAITQFKSILLDQKTKVNISLAVPFAGATLSFSMFAVGLLLSSNLNAAGDLVQVPSMLFQGSLLLGLISRATLGYAKGCGDPAELRAWTYFVKSK
ncbi:unnamed protein product [Camellia sinensis]